MTITVTSENNKLVVKDENGAQIPWVHALALQTDPELGPLLWIATTNFNVDLAIPKTSIVE